MPWADWWLFSPAVSVDGGTSLKLIVRWQGRYETFLSIMPYPHDLRPRYWRRQQKNELRLLPDPPVLPSTTKNKYTCKHWYNFMFSCIGNSRVCTNIFTFTVMLNERISNSRCNMAGKCYSIFWMYKIYKWSSNPHVFWEPQNISQIRCCIQNNTILHWYYSTKLLLQSRNFYTCKSIKI